MSVASLCRRYHVTASGFYASMRRGESAHVTQDRQLTVAIKLLFARHERRYGSPRLHRELQNAGWYVSRRRVARLMHCAGLRAKAVLGYRAHVTLRHLYGRHPNRLWTTTATAPNQIWVGDITYLRAGSTWSYLAIVMDQYSRRILAWTLTPRRTSS